MAREHAATPRTVGSGGPGCSFCRREQVDPRLRPGGERPLVVEFREQLDNGNLLSKVRWVMCHQCRSALEGRVHAAVSAVLGQPLWEDKA